MRHAGPSIRGMARELGIHGPAQVDALPFPRQLGEVGVVGALVALRRQFRHGGRDYRGSERRSHAGGRPPAAGGRGVGSPPPKVGGRGDGHLVFQNGVEHGKSGLFFLVQRYILHRMDIFAEQLAYDTIVEQQHARSTVIDPMAWAAGSPPFQAPLASVMSRHQT